MKSEWNIVEIFSQFQHFMTYLPVESINCPLEIEAYFTNKDPKDFLYHVKILTPTPDEKLFWLATYAFSFCQLTNLALRLTIFINKLNINLLVMMICSPIWFVCPLLQTIRRVATIFVTPVLKVFNFHFPAKLHFEVLTCIHEKFSPSYSTLTRFKYKFSNALFFYFIFTV